MKQITIYTCHHKPSAFLSSDIIKPIHVGKANSFNEICCAGDDTGDNISFKNPFYCELTAHYWVWKNAELSDFVGFMHYRRHLNFSADQNKVEDNWGVVNYPEITAEYEEMFGLNDAAIASCLEGYDILLPKKWDVRAAGSKNNYDHYKISNYLHIKDYQAAIDILLKQHPEYYQAVKEFNFATDGYYTNMYVMNRELFAEYSAWLFGIMSELEDAISFDNYNAQEKRVVGHISERLFNIFIIYKSSVSALKMKEVQRTFISQETFNGVLQPYYDSNAVPVVICFDDNYAMSGGALINSIARNSHADKNYDIVILENGVSQRNKGRLKDLVKDKPNMSIRFFDVNAFTELKGVYTRAHFSAATYARLFIPQLFKNFPRVLFIDADTVVESDVAELLELDIGNNLVAAVKDIVMEGFVKFNAIAQSETGVQTASQYLKTRLQMEDPDKYFQAGIILFNVAQMNNENTFAKLMESMIGQVYWFLDQDIMNKVFYDRVHYLPLCWNVYHGNGNTDDFFPNLKLSTYMSFLEARMHPKMIHYAGENKPWNTADVDFFDNFLKNVHNTPWEKDVYERLLSHGKISSNPAMPMPKVLLQTKVKRKLMPYFNRFAPIGSQRRSSISKLYYKIRRIVLG
ncbi:DUF4422 domain-containing protein [Rouxiella badensis]|uniref:DUF4422 domain-containing protein n=1 Tax=Rouxiella badensis TaxID=1646377 RepID=UPI0004781F48|nr:DUF4422 domain-containing protein [Rouxiella badensis]MCC3703381.1 DUF4422 domain-containing protein [Rouxiella badensis]MCC3731804.1 DUF4422 domain-containing protein [Rouxiella badensis]MCC3757193.1 DUF4422 domain-containing protein [Rouxiella badensis]QII37777.1 DUF4422 domain-containing protein [Rouxiella badensis]WAT10020.1 DUF4422 domain-containing protein [Rouxiella badensis]